MKKILMAMYLIGGLAMLFSCNDDSSSYPTPSDIDNLKATPGPGQITLSWTTPADENLYYVQVEYSIEATGKSYRKQVSQYASELVIDNLLQKYGEIDFTVQVFNRGNTAGPSHQITAQAEKASPTFGTGWQEDMDQCPLPYPSGNGFGRWRYYKLLPFSVANDSGNASLPRDRLRRRSQCYQVPFNQYEPSGRQLVEND